jgi:hypothetical protein
MIGGKPVWNGSVQRENGPSFSFSGGFSGRKVFKTLEKSSVA